MRPFAALIASLSVARLDFVAEGSTNVVTDCDKIVTELLNARDIALKSLEIAREKMLDAVKKRDEALKTGELLEARLSLAEQESTESLRAVTEELTSSRKEINQLRAHMDKKLMDAQREADERISAANQNATKANEELEAMFLRIDEAEMEICKIRDLARHKVEEGRRIVSDLQQKLRMAEMNIKAIQHKNVEMLQNPTNCAEARPIHKCCVKLV